MKKFLSTLVCLLTFVLAGCGGGGGSSSSANVQNTHPQSGTPATNPASSIPASNPTTTSPANTVAVTVDNTFNELNAPYVTLTVCVPGKQNCTTIDHVLVDTGSVGLRLLRSTLPAGLTNRIDPATGNESAECTQFAAGFLWGPTSTVDLQVSGETAASLPIQIIDNSFATIPGDCSDYGANMAAQGAKSLAANGIIGVGVLRRDCVEGCSQVSSSIYYDCSGASCSVVTMAFANQVLNPVSGFSSDNNGVILTFPTVPAGGLPTVTGTMTFGINTQPDNIRPNGPTLSTTAEGTVDGTFNGAFALGVIDSGSGALFFPDSTLTQCAGEPIAYYCPASPQALVASFVSGNNTTFEVPFTVSNAVQEFGQENYVVHAGLGVYDSLFGQPVVDLGMPFFYGKTVFFGIQGNDDFTAGAWPYFAIAS